MKTARLLLSALALLMALAAPALAKIDHYPDGRPKKPENAELMEEYYQEVQKWLGPIEKEFERLQAENLEALKKAEKEQVKFTNPNIRYARFIGGVLMSIPIPAMMACIGDKPCFSLMNCLEKPDLCKEGQTEAAKAVTKFKEEIDANVAAKIANDERMQQEAANEFTSIANDRNNRATGRTPDADPQGDKGGGMTVASNDDGEGGNPANPSITKDSDGAEGATTDAASNASGTKGTGDTSQGKTNPQGEPDVYPYPAEPIQIAGTVLAALQDFSSFESLRISVEGSAAMEQLDKTQGGAAVIDDNNCTAIGAAADGTGRCRLSLPKELEGKGGAVRGKPSEQCPSGQKCI